jgi:hypothetical protein
MPEADFEERSTAEVLDDHLRCRQVDDIEQDIARNYSPGVLVMTTIGLKKGHDAVRNCTTGCVALSRTSRRS